LLRDKLPTGIEHGSAGMATVGSGAYAYEPVENWAKLPPGWSFKEIGGVGVDRHALSRASARNTTDRGCTS
jgi:hypothetical protein